MRSFLVISLYVVVVNCITLFHYSIIPLFHFQNNNYIYLSIYKLLVLGILFIVKHIENFIYIFYRHFIRIMEYKRNSPDL